jgi:uncharacterized protein (DUF433 family)
MEKKIRTRADITINETPGVSGGYPCIGDTRIGVRHVVEAYRELGNIRRVKTQALPQLTHRQVRAACTYYQENPARVDEDIERNKLPEHP